MRLFSFMDNFYIKLNDRNRKKLYVSNNRRTHTWAWTNQSDERDWMTLDRAIELLLEINEYYAKQFTELGIYDKDDNLIMLAGIL